MATPQDSGMDTRFRTGGTESFRSTPHPRVTDDDAITVARRLAAEEGVFSGISGGASVATALQIAQQAEPGAVILAMLPDTGERYFSTPLFADINEHSDDAWLASLG